MARFILGVYLTKISLKTAHLGIAQLSYSYSRRKAPLWKYLEPLFYRRRTTHKIRPLQPDSYFVFFSKKSENNLAILVKCAKIAFSLYVCGIHE